MRLFAPLWRDKTTRKVYVKRDYPTKNYATWQQVRHIFGPLWINARYRPFRDWACNFEPYV